jgi:hypothetical protein
MANSYTDKLNLRIPTLGDTGWNVPLDDDIEIIDTTVAPVLAGNVVISGCVPSDGGVLDVDYTSGSVVVDGSEYAITGGSKTATVSSKNWLYVDDAGVVQISTTAPTGDFVLLALADADATALTNVADLRNMAQGAAALDLSYTPDNYSPDTGESKEIEQHLAGVDTQLGFMGGVKNKLINGGFDIWQRGTSQTSSGYGSDDRWANETGGASTKTHSQQAFTLGQTDVPGNPRFFSRTVVTTGAASIDYIRKKQKIEDVRTLAGQTVTLSFWAKADSSKNLAAEFVQYFGSGGSPSSAVTGLEPTLCALTTSWQQFVITADLPSISGKALGTDNNSCLRVVFWFEGGSSYDSRTNSLGNQSGTFDLAQVQLEAGEVATPFEARHIGQELALCQRYYAEGNQGFTGVIYTPNGDTRGVSFILPVTMRAAPTPIVNSMTGNITGPSGVITNRTITPLNISANSNRLRILSISDYSGLESVGYVGAFGSNSCNWTANAEL